MPRKNKKRATEEPGEPARPAAETEAARPTDQADERRTESRRPTRARGRGGCRDRPGVKQTWPGIR